MDFFRRRCQQLSVLVKHAAEMLGDIVFVELARERKKFKQR